jgi:uncharacterized protein YigA (DUF484 family)
VSLQERQAEMLRDKIKVLEHRMMDMIRHGNENMVIADRCCAGRAPVPGDRCDPRPAQQIAREIRTQFAVPQVASRCGTWRRPLPTADFAQGVSDDANLCLVADRAVLRRQHGFEAVAGCPMQVGRASLALLPLRAGAWQRHARALACWCWPRPTRSVFQRHGHRLPGTHRRAGQRGALAPA